MRIVAGPAQGDSFAPRLSGAGKNSRDAPPPGLQAGLQAGARFSLGCRWLRKPQVVLKVDGGNRDDQLPAFCCFGGRPGKLDVPRM